MGSILGKQNKRMEPNLNTVVENPGFLVISRKILLLLDHDTLLSCRLVSQSIRKIVDDPHFWIIKLDNEGQSKELHNAWIDLLQRIEKRSTLENEVSRCMMHWHGCQQQHDWDESAKNVIMPINIAAFYGYVEIVKMIASYQENPNAPIIHGWTPIHMAARHGHTEIVKILADKVENPNTSKPNGWTPIHTASQYGYTEIVRFLADKVENPNAPKPDGWTPIHMAARKGHTETFKILADKVENLNVPIQNPNVNFPGWTATQLAARNGHTEIVKILTDKVENPNTPNPDGWTPFQIAFFCGHFRTSFILLKK